MSQQFNTYTQSLTPAEFGTRVQEALRQIEAIKMYVLPPEADKDFPPTPEVRCATYDRIVEILYPEGRET